MISGKTSTLSIRTDATEGTAAVEVTDGTCCKGACNSDRQDEWHQCDDDFFHCEFHGFFHT